MKDIVLTLSINEVNLVLTALSKLPFEQVHTVIAKIQSQGSIQLSTPEEQPTE